MEDTIIDYRSILSTLGYKLTDNGNHWRTSALYRGGKNRNSVLIFKETGVWTDYGNDEEYRSFPELVKETSGKDSELYKKVKGDFAEIADIEEEYEEESDKIPKMKKVYDKDYFVLLPHYRFYQKRGISEGTLKTYNSGLAMSKDSMSNRFVFPVPDENGDIIGFNGRTIIKDDYRPKWKILGGKKNFCYPAFLKNGSGDSPVINKIEETSEVHLVESIGDSLSLFERGYENNLVTFGVSLSKSLLALLNRFNNLTIYICPNNDFEKDNNTGKIGAIKMYLDLSEFFDADQLKICLPTLNDFGDMALDEGSYRSWESKKEVSKKTDYKNIVIKVAERLLKIGNAKNGGIPLRYKKLVNNLKK